MIDLRSYMELPVMEYTIRCYECKQEFDCMNGCYLDDDYLCENCKEENFFYFCNECGKGYHYDLMIEMANDQYPCNVDDCCGCVEKLSSN